MVSNELNQLVSGQKELELRYQTILAKKLDLMSSTKNQDRLTEVEKEVIEAGADLKNSTHVFGRSLRQNPLTGDNMVKVQEDRYSICCQKEVPWQVIQPRPLKGEFWSLCTNFLIWF